MANKCVPLYYHATSHISEPVWDILATNNLETKSQPFYLWSMTTLNIVLFPKLEKMLCHGFEWLVYYHWCRRINKDVSGKTDICCNYLLTNWVIQILLFWGIKSLSEVQDSVDLTCSFLMISGTNVLLEIDVQLT